jgi:hypothetical protein
LTLIDVLQETDCLITYKKTAAKAAVNSNEELGENDRQLISTMLAALTE